MEHPVGKCGITFEKFQDIKEGDIIEAFVMEQIGLMLKCLLRLKR